MVRWPRLRGRGGNNALEVWTSSDLIEADWDTAVKFDANTYFGAWLDAATGKAPIYVKLEDSMGKTKTFRVQFGEPRTE